MEKFIRELHGVANHVKIMTITFGSILLMKIRKVKKDSDDLTLAIPSAILPGQLCRPIHSYMRERVVHNNNLIDRLGA